MGARLVDSRHSTASAPVVGPDAACGKRYRLEMTSLRASIPDLASHVAVRTSARDAARPSPEEPWTRTEPLRSPERICRRLIPRTFASGQRQLAERSALN